MGVDFPSILQYKIAASSSTKTMSKKLVLLNKSEHGFGLSEDAHRLFLKKAGLVFYTSKDAYRKTIFIKCHPDIFSRASDKRSFIYLPATIPRDHPALRIVFEELGLEGMNDNFSDLYFAEVDDNKEWRIRVIDGKEYISVRT